MLSKKSHPSASRTEPPRSIHATASAKRASGATGGCVSVGNARRRVLPMVLPDPQRHYRRHDSPSCCWGIVGGSTEDSDGTLSRRERSRSRSGGASVAESFLYEQGACSTAGCQAASATTVRRPLSSQIAMCSKLNHEETRAAAAISSRLSRMMAVA